MIDREKWSPGKEMKKLESHISKGGERETIQRTVDEPLARKSRKEEEKDDLQKFKGGSVGDGPGLICCYCVLCGL